MLQNEQHHNRYEELERDVLESHMNTYEETFKDQINDILPEMHLNNPIAKEVVDKIVLEKSTLFINDVWETIKLPLILKDHIAGIFENKLHVYLKEMAKNEDIDFESILLPWKEFIPNTIESIYHQELSFWDENILKNSKDNILSILSLFLYCQGSLTDEERQELIYIYKELSKWITKNFNFDESIDQELEAVVKAYARTIHYRDSESILEDKALVTISEINENIGGYELKFILLNIAMFLTGTVHDESKFVYNHYSPLHRHFLRNFFSSICEHKTGNKILSFIENQFGKPLVD